MELAGLSAGSQYDQLLVSGADTLAGTLQIILSGGFAPAAGNSFNILGWGTLSGTFTTVSLPALGPGLSWNTSKLYSTGIISVVGPAVPGDYNGNGIVDAADYVVWRDTLGSTTDLRANGDNSGASAGKIDQADYNVWRINFGNHASSGASAAVVPEPPILLLSILAAAGCFVLKARATHKCVTLVSKRPLEMTQPGSIRNLSTRSALAPFSLVVNAKRSLKEQRENRRCGSRGVTGGEWPYDDN